MPRMKKVFVVQPFWRSPDGLAACTPVVCPSETEARSRAYGMVPVYAGASVLVIEGAPEIDYCGEPEVVASYGETMA